jgi:hypothetical protein
MVYQNRATDKAWENAKLMACAIQQSEGAERPSDGPQPGGIEGVREAVAFLKRIDEGGWHNLVAIEPDKRSVKARTFPPGSWKDVASFIHEWNGKANLYFAVNEPAADAPHSKLAKNHVAAIRALFVDRDPDKSIPFEQARRALDLEADNAQRHSLPPSIIVDSGGGNQMIWLLQEKAPATAENIERAERQGMALADLYSGDRVQNVDRIFRLPGTLNIPNRAKRSADRVERPARVLSTAAAAYSFEDFENGIAQLEHASRGPGTDAYIAEAEQIIDHGSASRIRTLEDVDDELQRKFEAALDRCSTLRALWAGEKGALCGTDETDSGWRMSMARRLAEAGDFDADDYAQIVHAWPAQAHARDKMTLRALSREWGKFGAPVVVERRALIERFFQPDLDCAPETGRLDGWGEPADIFGDADPLELGEPPAQSLPPVLERYARSEARRKGVSMAFAAGAAVGVTAAAIGGSLRIQVRQHDTNWTEPASLWLSLVAEPGRAKSPTITEATKPLRELDGEHYRAGKVQHDLWAARVQAHKKQKDAPPPGPEPTMRRVTVDDVTFEKQVRIHADNPRGLLRTPDELMGFFGSFGAYKQKSEGDRTQMLRLFDGGPIMVDRVGAGSIRADHALMGIVAGTQPEKIAKVARDLGADGMLQRFLFIVDDGAPRRGIDEAPDAVAAKWYREMLRTLATGDYGAARNVRMSSEAQAIFNDTMANIDDLKGLVGMPVAWRGHVEKWGKILPRIVLTFHCVDMFSICGQIDPTAPVDRGSVVRAADFARFLLRHSMAFYRQCFDIDAVDEEARWFAGYLLTRPDISTATHRTLYDARTGLRGDANRRLRNRVFNDLAAAGWLRILEQGAEGPVRFSVNPAVHDRFRERAEWELRDREGKRSAIEKSGEARKWVGADRMSGKAGSDA